LDERSIDVALRGQLLSNAFDKTKSFIPYVVLSVITDPEVSVEKWFV
jgi:hypothetical protein